MASDPAPHHIFVDYENVQSIDLARLGPRAATVTLLLGKSQTKLPVALVQQLLSHPSRIRLIEMSQAGKNALDFALAYYLGQAVAADPQASFHVISRDNGFDPLVAHLRAQQVAVQRHDAFTSAVAQAAPAARGQGPVDDRIARVVERLSTPAADRPKRQRTLRSLINSWFNKSLSEAELDTIIAELDRRAIVTIDPKGAVTYR